MQTPSSTGLTDNQIDKLKDFLGSMDSMLNLEEVDGFFCALISCPDTVLPSEYLPYIFGEEMPDFRPGTQAIKILELLFHHWIYIADTLQKDKVYHPILFEDGNGKCQAKEWADGYMLGVELRRKTWSRLVEDKKYSGLIVPVMALHFEEDGSCPIPDDKRENLIAHMVAGILGIYRYFAQERLQGVQQLMQREQPKQIIQNDTTLH